MALASYTANAETSSFTRTHKTAKNTSMTCCGSSITTGIAGKMHKFVLWGRYDIQLSREEGNRSGLAARTQYSVADLSERAWKKSQAFDILRSMWNCGSSEDFETGTESHPAPGWPL